MASKSITEYEQKRLETIKQNSQKIDSLKLQTITMELSSETKRQRTEKKKTQVVGSSSSHRRSLRTKGFPPDPSSAKGIPNYYEERYPKYFEKYPVVSNSHFLKELGSFNMQDMFFGHSTDKSLINMVKNVAKNTDLEKRDFVIGNGECFDSSSMELKRRNIEHVMVGRIMCMKFFPCVDDEVMIIAGDAYGDIVFWKVGCEEGDGGRKYRYKPHSLPVSGISIKPFSLSKIFTSSNDGFIRMLDFETESFEFIHKSDSSISSLSQSPQDPNLIYFSENQGFLNIWDIRAGKASSSCMLHDAIIYTIEFNQMNANLMGTSSADKTACIWDLRQMSSEGPRCLKSLQHETAVHSAYFSPTGKSLATTTLDNHVSVFSGVDYENASIIYHNNYTGKWNSSFSAIWGWDDTSLFTGSMIKEVDVIHTNGGISHLRSSDMTDIPYKLTAHPQKIGTLAAATSGGQIYLWTQKLET